MKNRMSDLNNHLFGQMERLASEDLTPEQIETEVNRAEAMVAVADQISGNFELQLKAAKLYADYGEKVLPHLPSIGKSE
jgi:hypothetical protein